MFIFNSLQPSDIFRLLKITSSEPQLTHDRVGPAAATAALCAEHRGVGDPTHIRSDPAGSRRIPPDPPRHDSGRPGSGEKRRDPAGSGPIGSAPQPRRRRCAQSTAAWGIRPTFDRILSDLAGSRRIPHVVTWDGLDPPPKKARMKQKAKSEKSAVPSTALAASSALIFRKSTVLYSEGRLCRLHESGFHRHNF